MLLNQHLEDTDRTNMAALLSHNPKIVSMIQGRLGSLVGQSSGYIESLPAEVRKRILGLKSLQSRHSEIEIQLQTEFLELEKKYFAKFLPLYERRARIVNGKEEPNEDDFKRIEKSNEDHSEIVNILTKDITGSTNDVDINCGIPEFWLSAMKNQLSLAEMITDRDEAALRHLIDVRLEYFDRPGFRLIFEFANNEYFANKSITKTYYYQEESGYGGDFIYDRAEGDIIDWKTGQDLTMKIESKKQRNKSTYMTFYSLNYC